jgi:hypothetical protein
MSFGMGWQLYSFPEENFTGEYFVPLWSCVYSHIQGNSGNIMFSNESLKFVADLEELFM